MFQNNYRVPQAHRQKSACNGNQNSEGGKTWGVNKVGLEFNNKHWNLYFIWMAGRRWPPPSSSQRFQAQAAINARLAAASWNDNPYLVTCDELPLASAPSVSKDFSLRRCRKVNSLQQTYGPNEREAEFMTRYPSLFKKIKIKKSSSTRPPRFWGWGLYSSRILILNV